MAMKRQLSKKRGQQGSRWRWLAGITVIVAALCGVVWWKASIITAYYAKFSTWVADKRTHLVKPTTHPIKRVAANQGDAEPQIHFEFYTTLPNVRVGELNSVVKKEVKPSAPKVAIADADELESELSVAAKEAR